MQCASSTAARLMQDWVERRPPIPPSRGLRRRHDEGRAAGSDSLDHLAPRLARTVPSRRTHSDRPLDELLVLDRADVPAAGREISTTGLAAPSMDLVEKPIAAEDQSAAPRAELRGG